MKAYEMRGQNISLKLLDVIFTDSVPSHAMAGESEIPLIINRLRREDNFKKCAARPFGYSGFVSPRWVAPVMVIWRSILVIL